jgi:hypothetical protein
MERMDADGVTIVGRNDEPAYVAFKCLEPDGHRMEVGGRGMCPGWPADQDQ